MKRKFFIIFLTLCMLLSLCLAVACKNETPTGNLTGPQDYKESDSQLVTQLTVDISEKTEAFYIGSSAITSVKLDGELLSESDYVVGLNHILLPEGWYQNAGLGEHTIEITYKTKTLQFNVTIEDNKPLLYELPNDLNFYIPSDKATLPIASFDIEQQEKSVAYSLSNDDGEVDFLSTETGNVISNLEEGDYVYNIKVERKGQTVIDKNYPVNVVSRDYFEGIIDTTDGKMVDNLWINTNSSNSTEYVEEYTDGEGVTRSAVKFVRGATGDEYTRIVGLNPEKLKEMLQLGYKKLSFWYCADYDEIDRTVYSNGLQIYLMYSFGKNVRLTTKNVWTKAEIDISSLFTVSAIENRSSETKFAMGFATRLWNDSKKRNDTTTVYISEVVATDRTGDITPYVGEYVCGNEKIELNADGTATFNGVAHSAYVSNNYVVLTDENYNNVSGSIANGFIVLGGKVFATSTPVEYTQKIKSSLDLIAPINANGFTGKYFVTEGENDEIETTTNVFSKDKEYSLRVEIYHGTEKVGEVTKEVVVNSMKVDGNIAPNAFDDSIVSLRTQAGSGTLKNENNNLILTCSGDGRTYLEFDNAFISEALEQGYTTLSITFALTCVGTSPGSYYGGLYQYDADANSKYVRLEGKVLNASNSAEKTWSFNIDTYVDGFDFEGGDKLLIGALQDGTATSITMTISHLEFVKPVA